MPPLVRFLLGHMAVGIVAGWVVLGAFLAFDIAQLRTLITTSPDGPLALILLAAFFALTFGSIGMGMAAMSPQDDRDGRARRRPWWRNK